jgi:DedD protein
MENPVRYRMVGAILLIFLAVLFLPWLFDGAGYESMPGLEQPIPDRPVFVEPHLPSAPARPRLDRPDDSGATERTAVDVPEIPPAPAAEPEQPPQADAGVPAPPPRPAAARPAPSPAPVTADARGEKVGWAVQVGSFGREANAREQVQRLRDAGFPAFVERASVDGRSFWRVKVGPWAQRDEAMRLRDEIQRRMDITGNVIAHP